MADKVEKVLDIKVNYSEAIKAIAEYQTKVDEERDSQKKLKKELESGAKSRQQYNEEMAASKLKVADYNDSIRTITKTMQNQLKVEKQQEGSLSSLRSQLSNLTAAYDALSEADRKAAKGEELKNKINEITNSLKGAEEETQRYYRNVGNYKDSIMEAAKSNIPFINEINNAVTSLKSFSGILSDTKGQMGGIIETFKQSQTAATGLSTSQKVAATTTNLLSTALKILKVVLISTGIGAIVVALGALVAYLSKTQKGVELASKAMAALGAVVDVIIDRLSKLGGAIIKLFTGDFVGALTDTKEAFSGIGDEIARETKLAWGLQDALNQIEKQEVMLSMKRAANRAEIEKLKLIADDTTKSLKERTEAARKAYDMENNLQEEAIEIGKKKLANLLGQTELTQECNDLLDQMAKGAITADEAISKLGISESTVKDLKEFSQVFEDVAQKEMESYTRNRRVQNNINTMRKEAAEKAIAMKDKELAEVRKAEDAMLKLVKDEREKQSIEVSRNYDRQIQDLQTRLKRETDITESAHAAINEQIAALEQQKTDELEKLSNEALAKELEQHQKLIATQLEAVKQGSEKEFQLKMQQLLLQREAELSNKQLTEEMKLAIQDKYNKRLDDLATQQEQDVLNKQQEAMRIRFETEIAQARGNEEEILRIKMEQKAAELDALQQLEGESLEAFNLRKLEAENAYLDAKQNLANKEVEIEQTKMQAIADITNGLVQLTGVMGEANRSFAILSKTLALAEIAINTGKAIAAGVANANSMPFPANLAAIATTVSTILSNIAVATKTVKSAKFATGGVVIGPGTGTSDSIPAQLSNGESVMTARATEMFAPILSSFNMMGGGIPINVTQTGSQALGEDMLARAVAKGVQSIRPVVSVEEINQVNNRVEVLENLGSI